MAKLLVVEDHEEMRENIVELLSLSGYEVKEAPNGKVGSQLALQEMPDLIICDIMMPELDGYGMLYIMNKNPETRGIPFLFLTAKTEKEDFRKAMSLGADDFLTKPFDELDLLNAVEMRLNKRSQGQQTPPTASGKDMVYVDQLSMWTHARDLTLSRKETLFMEGSSSNYVYFLREGLVKELKTNRLGKEYITRLHRTGEFLGMEAVLEHKAYDTTAIALSNVKVSAIPTADFLNELHDHPALANEFIRDFARGLIDFQQKLVNMAYEPVRKRLAQSLIYLHEFFQQETHTIPLTREEIANLTGTTVETVIRTLAQFRKEGFIQHKNEGLMVTEPERLKALKN